MQLTVENSAGQSTKIDEVQIDDVPIQGLLISHDAPQAAGTAVDFAAGVSAGTQVAYHWSFGDGNTVQDIANPSHI